MNHQVLSAVVYFGFLIDSSDVFSNCSVTEDAFLTKKTDEKTTS